MSTSTQSGDGGFPTVGPDAPTLDRYRTITVDDGEILIYSGDDPDAWVQSDGYVDLERML